jgi:hypothetical protein
VQVALADARQRKMVDPAWASVCSSRAVHPPFTRRSPAVHQSLAQGPWDEEGIEDLKDYGAASDDA